MQDAPQTAKQLLTSRRAASQIRQDAFVKDVERLTGAEVEAEVWKVEGETLTGPLRRCREDPLGKAASDGCRLQ